jgi:DNA processing protein
MDVADKRLCLLLHSVPGLNDAMLSRLLLHCGGPAEVAAANPGVWREAGLSAGVASALARSLRSGRAAGVDIEAQLRALAAVGAQILPVTAHLYPPLLGAIHDPPPLLYLRGDPAVLAQAQLAMVGSRRASHAGLRAASTLAGEAVAAGLQICSGLAQGIDGAAHRGAVAAGGSTVAVVATGIDRVYPARHRDLADELLQSGCMVSEFPPGMQPLKHNFPRRNRIISALSLGVLVVEAAFPSGSLITARTALEQDREVFTLPWSIFHAGGAGCLRLLRDGAKMVTCIRDVLEELGQLYALQQELFPGRETPPQEPLTAAQQQVLEMLGYESTSADQLGSMSDMPVHQLMSELSALELMGLISRCPGGYMRC